MYSVEAMTLPMRCIYPTTWRSTSCELGKPSDQNSPARGLPPARIQKLPLMKAGWSSSTSAPLGISR